ncbi:DUF1740-domain-containing protein [Pyrenochaeta sp. DS3sAY3a]|nr:DUF1740-domain-containing protein [Pyrenochaeta sp. DS3sAY3a]
MAANVPKFTSFRPKPKPAPAAEPPKEPPRRRHVEEAPREKPRVERRRSPSPARADRKQAGSSNKPYFSDRRGDPDVWRYGTLNKYDIPSYRRFGYGCVLGLAPHQKIDREQSSEKEIHLTSATNPNRPQERLLASKRAFRSSDRPMRVIKAEASQTEIYQDYITLSNSAKRKRNDFDEDDVPDYRSFDQDSRSYQDIDPDTQYEPDTWAEDIHAEATRTNSELLRRTREHPKDLEGWMALIDHQEAMLKLDRISNELSPSDQAQLADIRISTYQEALKNFSQDSVSQIKLYQGLLSEARLLWPHTKLETQWNKVLSTHSLDFGLWLMYLDFAESNFKGFEYEDYRSKILKCFRVLTAGENGIESENALHLLLRLTRVVQESGYQELALAIWQAIIELHSDKASSSVGFPTVNDLSAFEEFWESETPRVGELGANGWKNADANNQQLPDLPPLRSEDPSNDVLQEFQLRETDAIEKLRYPGRLEEKVDNDEHFVFYSDMQDYLCLLPGTTSILLILDAFLCFCGLPPLRMTNTHRQTWRLDPFLLHQFGDPNHVSDALDQPREILIALSKSPSQFFEMTPQLLIQQDFSLKGVRLDPNFIRRVLKFVAKQDSSEDIVGEYLLAFELHHFPAQVQKTAKELLKSHPTSLRLYNAYGLIETHRGDSVKAAKVFNAALSMHKDTTRTTSDSLELLKSSVWESLYQKEPKEAVNQLVSSGSVSVKHSEQSLKYRQPAVMQALASFGETSEHALLAQDYRLAITSTALVALLTYASSDFDAKLALDVCDNLSLWFTSHKLSVSPDAELHAQFMAQLLAYHLTHAPIVKLAFIRTTLEPLIARFPNNTILLSLYAANEARFSINDRVRGIMHQTALQRSQTASIINWSFAIHYETLRGELSSSTSNAIRALYKRATNTSGAHCPALWKAYVRFEFAELRREQARFLPLQKPRKGEKKGQWEDRVQEAENRVKESFDDGLKKLPWCKDFIMLAFTELGEVFDKSKKLSLYDIMHEKELRLYIKLA